MRLTRRALPPPPPPPHPAPPRPPGASPAGPHTPPSPARGAWEEASSEGKPVLTPPPPPIHPSIPPPHPSPPPSIHPPPPPPPRLPRFEAPGPSNWVPLASPAAFAALLASTPPSTLIVVEYYVPWCPGCRTLLPKLHAIAAANPDAVFATVNGGGDPALAAWAEARGVAKLPWFELVRGGRVVAALAANLSAVARLRAEIAAAKACEGECAAGRAC